jgi:hypothetical protein
MEKIQLIQNTGIEVWGYYEVSLNEYHFTCINQDANTPQHQFQLDFKLTYSEYLVRVRSINIGKVYVPIVKPV